MAEQTEAKDQAQSQDAGGSNGGHTSAVRTVAIAAATGAAALAAKKAFSGRDQSGEGTQKSESGRGDESALVAMATSGWAAAKDSLLPFAEDAAGAAGHWVGRSGPEYLRDTIVPRFISSFERASKSSEQSD
jgi:hypothetical protein